MSLDLRLAYVQWNLSMAPQSQSPSFSCREPPVWLANMSPLAQRKSASTMVTSGKGHLALAVFRCFSCPRAS